MKTHHSLILAAALAALIPTASAQQPPAPPITPDKEPRTEAGPAQAAPATPQSSETEPGLRLNFRGVPLDMVLNYLSDAAGFIIVLDTEVKGKVDVWSNQPLTKQEAVDLLNTVLAKNGYAAIRNGRTLKIVSREDARTKDLPVRSGNDPDNIPKSEEMVTQVIPVRRANATQLIQNLQPLLPAYARDSFSANESGNALVLTATQSDVRRMVEIVKALDDSISGTSSIRVFALKYADAKELATAVKDLFQPQTQQNQGGRSFNNPFFGGRGGGNFGGGGFGNNNATPGGGRNASAAVNVRVTAVPDEHSNSLIVSGPEDVMPTIENLVREVDVPVSDVTELRVFHLNNANPVEIADIFAELFPDDTRTGNNQNDFRFGGGGFRALLNNRLNQAGTSERKTKKGRVMAVPDERTSSIIVSAASELMPQIAEMVAQLDASPARKQKVFVYSLENADVQQVEQILRDMFDRSNLQGNRNAANQNSALSNRQLNQQRTGQNGMGVGGFGNGVGGQGGGTGRSFR